MRYKISGFLTALSLFITTTTTAQHWCGTDHHTQQQIEEGRLTDEVYGPTGHASRAERGPASGKYIIPVVVHIIHDNGIGNISDEQVREGIQLLNDDFQRLNSDTSQTRPVFTPFAGGMDIEFRLARVDPNGNCTNGINRINDPQSSYLAEDNVKSLPGANWSSSNGPRYLEFWLVNSIAEWVPGGIILGYAEFPGFNYSSTWGVVARHDRWGTIGTGVSDGRTITHEVGHCFRLLHTFQSGCGNDCSNSGDQVCDTPPAAYSTQGCNQSQNNCSNDANGSMSVYNSDVVDQIENYMSYDDCQNMFSLGQIDRMKDALDNRFIKKLWTESNLLATGVDPIDNSLCSTTIDADQKVVCVGTPVHFSEYTFHNPEAFDWDFPGGIADSDTSRNPTVVYTEPGTYPVSLTVSAGAQSVTSQETDFITVLPLGPTSPLVESFETSDLASDFWSYSNPGFDYNWELTSNASASGNQALMVDNHYSSFGTSVIISPSYDLSNLFSATVTFDMAYASRTGSEPERLRVYVSGDCGQSWQLKWGGFGPSMTTAPNTGASFYPTDNQWVQESFSLNINDLSRNTRFRFEFAMDGGNNVFIDNINITGLYNNIPSLREPLNNAANVHAYHKLDWNATVITQEYEVQADITPDFNSSQLRTSTVNWAGNASDGADTEVQFNTMWTAGQTYYWRVRTNNNGNAGPWSEVWSFTAGQLPAGVEPVVDQDDVRIYPNPMNDIFVIDELQGVDEIVISDLTGRLIRTVTNPNNRITIEAGNWQSGVYLIQVHRNNRVHTQRIIKQ